MAMAFRHGEHYKYTYRDYLRIPDDGKRWELIDGVPYMMAAPSRGHQRAAGKIFRRISNFLDGRRCEAFMSPFDVRLPVYDEERTEDVINVLQPDVSVYCNQLGTDEKGGRIAPDVVVEVLSQSSNMDKIKKFKLYEKAGVKEYWIVDPKKKTVEVHLHNGKVFFSKTLYGLQKTVFSSVLEGFEIEISDIFAEPDWE